MSIATPSRKVPQLRVRQPTFSASGSTFLTVGRSKWRVDPSWPTATTADGQLGWVLLPDNDLRCLSAKGEIVGIGPDILNEMRSRLFDK